MKFNFWPFSSNGKEEDKSEKNLVLSSNAVIGRVKNLVGEIGDDLKTEKAKLRTSTTTLRLALKSYFKNPDENLKKQIFEFFDTVSGDITAITDKLSDGPEKQEAGKILTDVVKIKEDLESYTK